MAGIGFELLKIWKEGTYSGLLRAYALTSMIGSGPGLFVILGLGIVCFFNLFAIPNTDTGHQFITITIYLFSSSMIISSFLQFTFFRFIADKIFSKDFELVTPNFNGVLLVQLIISICFALPIVFYFFSNYSMTLKILLISTFNILCMIWISTVLLTGFKSYRRIIWAFVLGYSTMIIVHFLLRKNDILTLLFEFLLAQTILFSLLLHAILDFYPGKKLIKFDFLKRENFYSTIVFANFFYNLGFWIDKYLFWYNTDTSYTIFPPLRFSPIYDFPMFIAYVTIIPAIAAFIFQIEAKFAIIFPTFMDTIFRRKTLTEIDTVRNQLISAGRDAVFSLIRTESIVIVILFLSASFLFSVLNVVSLYLNVLFILIIAAGLNVILWGLLNIMYYMTRYRHAFYVSFVFFISNLIFTLISFYAGPVYFGYGFCVSLLLSIIFALIFLNEDFNNLEYLTFMMTD